LKEVLLEIVENLAPFHYVDAFDGNYVHVNGVIPYGGNDVSIA
jgi:hypothetical protein